MSNKQRYQVWNGTLVFEVARIEKPASLDELSLVFERALNEGRHVKAVGIGHGNTDVTAPADDRSVFVSLENINAVKHCTDDEITVDGGMTLHSLCQYLHQIGREPYVVLEYGFFHIGAICGTHAHDTNSAHSTLFSSHVTGMKVLTYDKQDDGTFRAVQREFHESTHPREMQYLRSHFGMLGIVYEVTIRTRPSKMIAVQFTKDTIDRFIGDVESRFYDGDSEQTFITFIPDTREVLVEKRRRLEGSVQSQKRSIKGVLFFWGRLKLFFHIEKLSSLLKWRPVARALDYAARKTFMFILPMATRRPIVFHPCERAVVYEGLPKFDYVEWAYPVDRIADVLKDLLDLQNHHGLSNIFNLYLEKHDNESALSRSSDEDRITIDIVNAKMDGLWFQFVDDWNKKSIDYAGIPHFSKTPNLSDVLDANDLTCFFAAQNLQNYAQFKQVMDPEGFFSNRIEARFSPWARNESAYGNGSSSDQGQSG